MGRRKLGNVEEIRPGVFKVRVSMGTDASGRRRVRSKTIKGNARDAEKALVALHNEKSNASKTPESRMRLTEFVEHWLSNVAAPRVRRRTLRDYGEALHRYVLPSLGSTRLDKLHTVQIQQAVTDLAGLGLAPRTVRYPFKLLRTALKYAVRVGWLQQNPTDDVELPRSQDQEMRSLTPHELNRFLAEVKGTQFEALWLLLVAAGLRPGEALGLKWRDIQSGSLTVRRTLTRVGEEWIFDAPKTKKSRRKVLLPSMVMEALEHHRERQEALRLRRLGTGKEWADMDLVFCTAAGQPLEWRVVARRSFKPLAQKAGLRQVRPYDLRHTFASLLIAQGNSVNVVSEMLGHSKPNMTLNVYSHVLPGMHERAVAGIEQILRAQENDPSTTP